MHIFKKHLNYFSVSVTIIIQKESTHSKGGCSEFRYQMSLWTPPILLADRIGIFICACFSYRERQATQQLSFQRTSAMPISLKKSWWFHKLSSAPPPFLCIPANRYHKLGRLPPCHGYFTYLYITKRTFEYQPFFPLVSDFRPNSSYQSSCR